MSDTTSRTLEHEGRIAKLEQIADETRRVLERLDHRMDRLEDKMDTRFLWLLGVMLATFAGLLGAIAHGFRWL